MKHVNITIIVTSCDDPELYVKYETEESSVDFILNARPVNLLKPFVEQLLEMEGKNELNQSSNPGS